MTRKLIFTMGMICLSFLLICAENIQAQEHTVRGTVVDGSTQTPLPGVNVTERGTSRGTVTDLNGNYSISVSSPNAGLDFSYVGYLAESVNIDGKSTIDVLLVEDIFEVDAVVVIGYGTQRKSDLTGSVSVVNTENLERIAGSDISRVLQGQTPGVQVFGAGEPGAIPRVQIRGVGTFGNTAPLYVIDGVPIANATNINISGQSIGFENHAPGYGFNAPAGGISDFNPADIESVQVLKDASAAAIYGARGANGVIIITTKRGRAGEMQVTYDGNYGIQNVAKRMELTNREQFQHLSNLARANNSVPVARTNNPDHEAYIDNIDTDWQQEFFTQGHITDHNLSFRGGTENSQYYASINYFDQSGTAVGPGPKYTRYRVQLNLDQQKGRFKFGQSFSYSSSDQIRLTSTRWNNIVTELVMAIPTVQVYDENNLGGYGGGTVEHGQIAGNPVAFNNLRDVNFKRHRFFGVVYGELEILKSLSYRVNLSYDRSEWFNTEFVPQYYVGNRHTWEIPYLKQWRGENPVMIMEHLLNFNQTFGMHNLSAVVGYTAQKDHIEDLYGYAEGFEGPPYLLRVLSAVPSGQLSLNRRIEHAMISYLGRVDYSFDDRYFVTASMRRDYSSNFGPLSKYGDFPSFAGAWKLSSEDFFDVPIINLLKFRGGWGKIGNENIGSYLYETTVNSAVNYVFDGQLFPGTTQTYAVDPSLRWEERTTSYIGLDLYMLRNKVEFSAEYYHNEANDILMAYPIPISSGAVGWSIRQANGASMINKGMEFNLSYRKYEGDFHYQVGGNLTTLRNEITKIGDDGDPIVTNTSKSEVGGEMGQLFVWETDGIFQSMDEINIVPPSNSAFDPDKHAFQHNQTRPGDIRFKDVNGDGIINDNDRVYLGSVFPKFTYGFNVNMAYKRFDLSVFLQGVYGNKVYNGVYATMSALQEGNYSLESYENYWREDAPSNTWPRPTYNDYNQNNRPSDRWIQDGSYLRVQNVQLGYALSGNVIDRIPGVGSIRIYLQAQNLFTITGMVTYDPDFINDGLFNRGFAGGSYPSPRTFMAGVKLTL